MDMAVVGAEVAANNVAAFPFVQTVLILLACAIGYAVIARGLFLVTDPVRHSLLDLADDLVANPKFPEEERAVMEFALGKVFSAPHAWRMALDTAAIAIRLAFRSNGERRRPDYDPSYAKSYVAFQLRWTVSVLGNSPAASFVFLAFLMILAAFAISAGAIARLLMHGKGGGHDGTAVAH